MNRILCLTRISVLAIGLTTSLCGVQAEGSLIDFINQRLFSRRNPPASSKLSEVIIVSNALSSSSWSDVTTPPPVASNAVVKLRAIIKMDPPVGGHYYFWNYDNGTATLKGISDVNVYKWQYVDPTITWNRIYPFMWHQDSQHCNDPNPLYPILYEHPYYTNSWTMSCTYQNIRHREGEFLGRNGFYSGTNEAESALSDIVEYLQSNCGSGWELVADSDVGTMRYRVAECYFDAAYKVHSPGIQANTRSNLLYQDQVIAGVLEKRTYYKGIMGNVMRIARRSTDSNVYVSHIGSYMKVPWIFGSDVYGLAQTPSTEHQTERYVGFDCADLAVGARRRMTGNQPDYTGAHQLATGDNGITQARGNYGVLHWDGTSTRDSRGNPVTVPIGTGTNDLHIGDLILFKWQGNTEYTHTTVLFAGSGTLGSSSVLIFASHTGVMTKTLSEEAQSSIGFVLRKWPGS